MIGWALHHTRHVGCRRRSRWRWRLRLSLTIAARFPEHLERGRYEHIVGDGFGFGHARRHRLLQDHLCNNEQYAGLPRVVEVALSAKSRWSSLCHYG